VKKRGKARSGKKISPGPEAIRRLVELGLRVKK
jgi:hypothetical protein